MPAELGRILSKALEKDRNLRCQTATELKTDLLRLKRDTDSGGRRAAEAPDSRSGAQKAAERSVAVLYFENLSGVKEDEYLRDGVTEDIITELSKIKGLKVLSRQAVLPFRDKPVATAQVGQQLKAACVLAGSIRRGGNRLRITAQLVDAASDSLLWSERYDREMADVFAVQDEIARKIAEALRVQLSPQEQQAIAAKPTENLQAYDLYLRGRSYARRHTRQDLEFALQMFENAVSLDHEFALAYAAISNVCAQYHYNYERQKVWLDRSRDASRKAIALQPDLPEVKVAQAWILYTQAQYEEAAHVAPGSRREEARHRGGLLPHAARALRGRPLPGRGGGGRRRARGERHGLQRLRADHERARGARQEGCAREHAAAGDPGAREPPEDGAGGRAGSQRPRRRLRRHGAGRRRGARGEPLDHAAPQRGDRALQRGLRLLPDRAQARRARGAAQGLGRRLHRPDWARRDPDLALLHGDPEFERLYPAEAMEGGLSKPEGEGR